MRLTQDFAIKGYKVKLFDNDSGVLKSAPERIGNNLQTLLEMGLVGNNGSHQRIK